MLIRVARLSDVAEWAELRSVLWPEATAEEHRSELDAGFACETSAQVAFLAIGDDTVVRGFAEASLRHDYVNGCSSSPVAFFEGVFVRPEYRRTGVGRRLFQSVQAWALEHGCVELASDAVIQNVDSHAFHAGLGFEETERVIFFRKPLL